MAAINRALRFTRKDGDPKIGLSILAGERGKKCVQFGLCPTYPTPRQGAAAPMNPAELPLKGRRPFGRGLHPGGGSFREHLVWVLGGGRLRENLGLQAHLQVRSLFANLKQVGPRLDQLRQALVPIRFGLELGVEAFQSGS